MKKAFSLIELMIVIVIMGVVYTLVITKLKTVNEPTQHLRAETLKTVLYKIAKREDGVVKLLCLDQCQVCSIYLNNEKYQDLQESFLDKNIEIYTYDYIRGLEMAHQELYFDENDVQKDVCFSFEVNQNRVASQVILKQGEDVFDYTDYFADVVHYDSIQEMIAAKEKLIEEVQ